MHERPILFSAPMVRAILDGRKTQTRRALKPYRGNQIVNLHEAEPGLGYSGRADDPASWGYPFLDDGAPADLASWADSLCPYGQPGDRLWVKETWWPRGVLSPWDIEVTYAADGAQRTIHDGEFGDRDWNMPKAAERGNVSPLFMPRWASRILLEITGVRVERLQNISVVDALAEGIAHLGYDGFVSDSEGRHYAADPIDSYADLWESINGAGSWNANPWVWVVEFRRLDQSNG